MIGSCGCGCSVSPIVVTPAEKKRAVELEQARAQLFKAQEVISTSHFESLRIPS